LWLTNEQIELLEQEGKSHTALQSEFNEMSKDKKDVGKIEDDEESRLTSKKAPNVRRDY
jgi:hypothetical protein